MFLFGHSPAFHPSIHCLHENVPWHLRRDCSGGGEARVGMGIGIFFFFNLLGFHLSRYLNSVSELEWSVFTELYSFILSVILF